MAVCVSGDCLVFAEPTRSVIMLVTVAEATCTILWSENDVGMNGFLLNTLYYARTHIFSKVFPLLV